ncbi:TetR family transcriptional regulator [Rhodococcus sp. OK519]|uniref:TetR/AcrR family transcriptional regulator n=1 Tax=Rhodococcus sp. OK519 TaxID=2135729 RepID=UPI000D46EB64|nr:TetR family transcriptional regulator [Rhodococcus sp. OK519]
MAPSDTERGAAARTMQLLWSPPGAPSPSTAGLTLEAIIDAATVIADERGDAAVPLRAIGDRLGCTAMALYTYVGGKAELLDLMHDRTYAQFGTAPPVSVVEWCERLLELYLAHPWMLDLAHSRPALGPHQQQAFESLLGTLVPNSFDRRDVVAIASSAFSLPASAARTIVDARGALSGSVEDNELWWNERMDTLAAAAPDFAARFPLASGLSQHQPAAGTGTTPDDVPTLERAARDNLRRAVELLVAGASGRD